MADSNKRIYEEAENLLQEYNTAENEEGKAIALAHINGIHSSLSSFEVEQLWKACICYELFLPNDIFERNLNVDVFNSVLTRIQSYVPGNEVFLKLLPHDKSKCVLRISFLHLPSVTIDEYKYHKALGDNSDSARLAYYKDSGEFIANDLSNRATKKNMIKGYKDIVSAVSSDTTPGDDLLSKLNSLKYGSIFET